MVKLTKVQTLFLLIVTLLLSSCGGGMNFPDAKDQPVNADERVKNWIFSNREKSTTLWKGMYLSSKRLGSSRVPFPDWPI